MTWLVLAVLTAVVALALPYTATYLMHSLEAHPALADPPQLDGVGAIIVLGGDYRGYAPEMGGDTVGPMTLQRAQYAARLHRRSGIPLLVTGGYVGRDGRALADCMAEVLNEDFNLTARWIERTSRTTLENAQNCKIILDSMGIRRVCLVTHAFHMVRSASAFARHGFDVVAAPIMCQKMPTPLWRDFVPNEIALCRCLVALREWTSRTYYAVSARRETKSGCQRDTVHPPSVDLEGDVVTPERHRR